jgi:hypothetical protein
MISGSQLAHPITVDFGAMIGPVQASCRAKGNEEGRLIVNAYA